MKKILLSTAIILSSSTMAMANDDVSYSAFIKYRNFGSKKGITSTPVSILPDPTDGGKAIFPTINSFAMSYFGNMGRTIQDTIAMGDWDKQYRVTMGYEQNYIKSDNSSSSYGYRTDIGNFYLTADKKTSQNTRLGAGIVLGAFNSDYAVDNMYQDTQNIMTTYHFIYRNKEQDILHRSILYLGYGKTDLQRVSNTDTYKSDFSTIYYGLENIAYKNIKIKDSGFYLRPVAELNYYGTHQQGFSEGGQGYNLPDNDAYKIDIGLAFYAGYKFYDFDLRLGYDWTSILSDPRKAYGYEYFDGSAYELSKKTSDNNYGTWRASLGYKINDDLSWTSDIRYYEKEDHNIMFTLGLNYSF